jgi:mono/diheme cytochrome c family protein
LWFSLVACAGCKSKVADGKANGAEIYAEVCARCHGYDGTPDAVMIARLGVKPLTSDHVRHELKDDDIRNQILHGSQNKQMPSFQGALTDEQIAAVIAHVRALPTVTER